MGFHLELVFLLREEEGERAIKSHPPVGICVAMAQDRMVIPNEREGSRFLLRSK